MNSDPRERAPSRLQGLFRRLGGVALATATLASLALAGCDKCGDPIKFNTPSIPKSCYGVSQQK